MHKRAAIVFVLIAAGALAITTIGASGDDLTITKSTSVSGNTFTSQTLLKGPRERTTMQMGGASNVTLRQCDMHRTVTLNDTTKNFLVHPDMATVDKTADSSASSGGTITYTSRVVDTGEKKTAFGYTARHLKISIVAESSATACTAVKQKYDIDGWYIDLPGQSDCQRFSPFMRPTQGCTDQLIFKQSGKIKPGYAIQETVNIQNGDDQAPSMTVTSEVTELKKGPLDAALFEVPKDYHEVTTSAELGSAAPNNATSASGAQPSGTRPNPGSVMSPTPSGQQEAQKKAWEQAAAMGMAPPGGMPNMGGMGPGMGSGVAGGQQVAAPQALGPKAAGKIRIGVVVPQAQMGQGSNAQMDYGTPIRNAIVLMMSGPAVEVTALDSRIPVQIEAEAKQKECDFVLYSTLVVKHGGGGGFGKLMSKAGPLTSMAPMMGGKGGALGAAAGQVAAQASAQEAQQQVMSQLGQVNGQIKSKDDVTMSYQLFPTGQDNAALTNTLQAKAKSDGEDVLTPMITQVATAVLTQVTKK
jgi:hypothetical protein